MAIEFRCSQCNQLLRVPDDSAGKNARCPKCQSLMTVPAAGPTQTPLSGAATSFSPPPAFSPPVPPPPKPPTTAAPPASSPFAAAPSAPPPPPNPYASSQIPAGYGPANPNQAPMLLAVGSLATAVMGLLSCACCLFMPFPPIALLLGILALCFKPDQQARTIAIIGIVLSALCLILFAIGIIVGLAGPLLDPQFRQQMGR